MGSDADAADLFKRFGESLRRREEEHQRRLAEDPQYRREFEEKARLEEEQAAREAAHHRERAERKCAEALRVDRETAGIPTRAAQVLDSPALVETPALLRARRFKNESQPAVLVLAGPVGVGKTVGACEALHYEVEKTIGIEQTKVLTRLVRGRFIRATDVAHADTYGRGAREFWTDLVTAHALVIDDVAATLFDRNGYVAAKFSNLLCARYDDGRKTIITTNLTQRQFIESFVNTDKRLLDRIREGAEFFGIRGNSLRVRWEPST